MTKLISLADGTAYVGSATEAVLALDAGTGERRWRAPLRNMYFGGRGSDAEVIALDRRSGEVVWRAPAGYHVERIEPTAEAVFVGSEVDDPEGGILARVDCFGLDGTRR